MNTHAEKIQENKRQSVANSIVQKQSNSEHVFQYEDNRPEALRQHKLQEIANNSPQVKQAAQLQAIANNYTSKQQNVTADDTAPIQRKKSKKSGWNQKQIDQNKRLFRRRAIRQEGYARARERERLLKIQQNQQEVVLVNSMKAAQRLAFLGFSPAVQAGMMRLYHRGFQLQNSSGRAVFNIHGNFDACKRAATSIFGNLGNDRENGVDTVQVNGVTVTKERYMVNWNGVNIIIRNFSSSTTIWGTIEFQTGVRFEFKYQ